MFGITLIESSWTTLIEIAVYIKSHINYRVRHNLINPDIEAIIIEIIKPNSKPFAIVASYRLPVVI
jgi:hypothetical protein